VHFKFVPFNVNTPFGVAPVAFNDKFVPPRLMPVPDIEIYPPPVPLV
jgi:hypothetical protein